MNRGVKVIDVRAREFDPMIVASILRDGHHDGAIAYVLRSAVPTSTCRVVYDNFRRVIDSLGSDRADDGFVRTHQVGATQFDSTGAEYARKTIDAQHAVSFLFDGISDRDASQLMMDDVLPDGLAAGAGLAFGPARFKSTYANACTVRAWLDNGEMALHPHDDISQIEHARQDHFEIERVTDVVSYNACVKAAETGGELTVWNLRPSVEFRRNQGVYDTGYPYPQSILTDVLSVRIDLKQGDCYFLNSSYLHGVQPGVGQRVTAGRFIGAVSPYRAVHWT
jgi:L-isoleucine 31-dioxygenase